MKCLEIIPYFIDQENTILINKSKLNFLFLITCFETRRATLPDWGEKLRIVGNRLEGYGKAKLNYSVSLGSSNGRDRRLGITRGLIRGY